MKSNPKNNLPIIGQMDLFAVPLDTSQGPTGSLRLFCWNIGNPSPERAAKQAEWLRCQPVDVFVLTETKQSKGCLFLSQYFAGYGYEVLYPYPDGNEYGTMIVSKLPMQASSLCARMDYLCSRLVSATVTVGDKEIEIAGV